MKLMKTLIATLFIIQFFATSLQGYQQRIFRQGGRPIPAVGHMEAQAKQDDEKEAKDTPTPDESDVIEAPRVQMQEPGAREIRLTLWDGTVVTGDIGLEFIKVETQFGKLEVPVQNIINLRPGLDSFPQMNQKINALVEQLGDRDFQTREKAHRELVAMGMSIRSEIQRFEDGGSAERKKHLDKIREQIDEMTEDQDDWDEGGEDSELIRGDTIQTRDFTIVGKILEPEFSLSSKYGNLTIALADIKSGDRTWLQTTQSLSKSVSVQGNSFFQNTPVSSKIRVNKGDRIKIKATGTVQWASWGNISSGPAGITNQGNWQGHNCGTLLARVGKSGEYIKIGAKGEFVAKTSGVLFLGISMRDNYAQQAGYQWPGEYKARITVVPSATETP